MKLVLDGMPREGRHFAALAPLADAGITQFRRDWQAAPVSAGDRALLASVAHQQT